MYILDVEHLHQRLTTKRVGRKLLFYRAIKSTNDSAKRIAMQGAPDGTVVIAETQTGGRGRLGRKWFSPEGGLWFSIILRPKISPSEAANLPFVAGLAVAQTLNENFSLDAKTKWPNDVLIGKKKVCGILNEMSTSGDDVHYIILGIGINVNFGKQDLPSNLHESATSLQAELDRKVELGRLLATLLKKLESLYDKFLTEGFNMIRTEWKSLSGILGEEVEVYSASERSIGLALDVDHDGALIIQNRDGSIKRVISADVSLHK